MVRKKNVINLKSKTVPNDVKMHELSTWMKGVFEEEIGYIQEHVIKALLEKSEVGEVKQNSFTSKLNKDNFKLAQSKRALEDEVNVLKRDNSKLVEVIDASYNTSENVKIYKTELTELNSVVLELEKDRNNVKSMLKLEIDKIVDLEEKTSLMKALLSESARFLKQKQLECDSMNNCVANLKKELEEKTNVIRGFSNMMELKDGVIITLQEEIKSRTSMENKDLAHWKASYSELDNKLTEIEIENCSLTMKLNVQNMKQKELNIFIENIKKVNSDNIADQKNDAEINIKALERRIGEAENEVKIIKEIKDSLEHYILVQKDLIQMEKEHNHKAKKKNREVMKKLTLKVLKYKNKIKTEKDRKSTDNEEQKEKLFEYPTMRKCEEDLFRSFNIQKIQSELLKTVKNNSKLEEICNSSKPEKAVKPGRNISKQEDAGNKVLDASKSDETIKPLGNTSKSEETVKQVGIASKSEEPVTLFGNSNKSEEISKPIGNTSKTDKSHNSVETTSKSEETIKPFGIASKSEKTVKPDDTASKSVENVINPEETVKPVENTSKPEEEKPVGNENAQEENVLQKGIKRKATDVELGKQLPGSKMPKFVRNTSFGVIEQCYKSSNSMDHLQDIYEFYGNINSVKYPQLSMKAKELKTGTNEKKMVERKKEQKENWKAETNKEEKQKYKKQEKQERNEDRKQVTEEDPNSKALMGQGNEEPKEERKQNKKEVKRSRWDQRPTVLDGKQETKDKWTCDTTEEIIYKTYKTDQQETTGKGLKEPKQNKKTLKNSRWDQRPAVWDQDGTTRMSQTFQQQQNHFPGHFNNVEQTQLLQTLAAGMSAVFSNGMNSAYNAFSQYNHSGETSNSAFTDYRRSYPPSELYNPAFNEYSHNHPSSETYHPAFEEYGQNYLSDNFHNPYNLGDGLLGPVPEY